MEKLKIPYTIIVEGKYDRLKLLNICDEVRVVEPYYTDGCMLRRDKAMVDGVDVLISVWDGSHGGTGWTVRYAKQQGKSIRALWL